MTTAADLAQQLKAKRCERGWLAKCPAHDDHRASLSIGEGEGGRLLLKCHAGCTFDAIMKAAGVEPTSCRAKSHATRCDRATTKKGVKWKNPDLVVR